MGQLCESPGAWQSRGGRLAQQFCFCLYIVFELSGILFEMKALLAPKVGSLQLQEDYNRAASRLQGQTWAG